MTTATTTTYKDAGVDIEAGAELVRNLKPIVKRSHHPHVMNSLGGFNALCEIPKHYKEPVLVSCTDGVGTKIKLASQLKKYDTIGIDLVAMCVNDLIVCGAAPLFFLDYYAVGELDVGVGTDIIRGIVEGCEQSGAALVGGETAEMPGVYSKRGFDLAGFSVGVVEKSKIIDCQNIKAGDALIGIASSGLHSNGFSLVRKILTEGNISLDDEIDEINAPTQETKTKTKTTLGELLLRPTRIYVKPILTLLKSQTILGMAHITGGGLFENIPRMLPADCQAIIQKEKWDMPAIFHWLQDHAKIEEAEMLRTFNCGLGMVCCVPAADVESCLAILREEGETAWRIGEIAEKGAGAEAVRIV